MQAVLILAHKNIQQIIQLANLLSRKFEVYIHLDKKCPVESGLMHELESNIHAHFFQKIDVHWGGLFDCRSYADSARRGYEK